MKRIIKFFGFSALLLTILYITSCAPSKKATKEVAVPKYELEAMPTGVQGTYLIKVWTYSVEPMPNIEQVKRNAVHGIIFEGFKGKPGIPGQVAIASDPKIETEKADYFNAFFADGGDYKKFVDPVNNGAIAAEDRMRMGKVFKIGMVCTVKAAALRKHLEEAGVIRSLDEGFK